MRVRLQQVPLRWLPLAIAAIAIATAIPIDIGAPAVWHGGFRTTDFFVNLLLFAPLGIALWRRSIWTTALMACLLSTTFEIAQVWSIDRFSSPYDVVANTAGAVLAAIAWRAVRRRDPARDDVVVIGASGLIALLLVAAAIVAVWWRPGRSSAVAGWDRSYPLIVGNDNTGDRAWHGDVSALAIYPSALSRAEVRALAKAPADAWPQLAKRATYVSSEPMVFKSGRPLLLPASTGRDLADGAERANAVTIAARVRPNDLEQSGPTSIVSFSADRDRRNLDLGREGPYAVLRVQSAIAGTSADETGWVDSPPMFHEGEETTVVATYDGAVARVYVAGTLVSRTNLASYGCAVAEICGEAEAQVWPFLGAIFALVGVALVGVRSRARVWPAALAGALLALALWRLHPYPPRIASAGWTPWLAVLGGAAIAISVRIGENVKEMKEVKTNVS